MLPRTVSEVNNKETIAAIEVNDDTYCLQKRIEKFPLVHLTNIHNYFFCPENE